MSLFDNIPQELKELPQWLVWRLELNDEGKWTKRPYRSKRPFTLADPTDPSTWSTFDKAAASNAKPNFNLNGIGFVLCEKDPYTFIDFDHVICDGKLEDWAQAYVAKIGSYAEVSQSGTGIHIVTRAVSPCKKGRKLGQCEIYDHDRYMICTGDVWGDNLTLRDAQDEVNEFYAWAFPEKPTPIKPLTRVSTGLDTDRELLEKAFASRSGEKIRRLFNGDTSDHDDDDSAADLSLCCHLAFWTGRDAHRIDHLFRQSGLMRDKWDSRRGDSTYGAITIAKACESTSETYSSAIVQAPSGTEPTQTTPPAKVEEEKPPKKTQATRLADLVRECNVELFHTEEQVPYVRVPVGGHWETLKIRCKRFKSWLKGLAYKNGMAVIGDQTIQDVLGVFESAAFFENPCCPVFLRMAKQGEIIYIDLANEHWQAIEITSGGWRVISDPPVKFYRAPFQLPLPVPQPCGTVNNLREFVNLESEDSWRLLLFWIMCSFDPTLQHPVLAFFGEQGSGKSTITRLCKRLIDPSRAEEGRSEPKDPQALMIAAKNNWVLSYDNISHLPNWLSDSLCRLCTGGSLSSRALFTDDDEIIFIAKIPVIINGITEVIQRPDLLDRTIILSLPRIAEMGYRPPADFWDAFDCAHPQILGAFLDAVVAALRGYKQVNTTYSRFADCLRWATAAEATLGLPEGAFVEAYKQCRKDANRVAIDSNVIAASIVTFMANRETWTGSSTELLRLLTEQEPENLTRQKDWPKSAQSLSGKIMRLASNLRAEGIEYERANTRDRRLLTLRIVQGNSVTSVTASLLNLKNALSGDTVTLEENQFEDPFLDDDNLGVKR